MTGNDFVEYRETSYHFQYNIVGNLLLSTNGMRWHAMACNGMQWHAPAKVWYDLAAHCVAMLVTFQILNIF